LLTELAAASKSLSKNEKKIIEARCESSPMSEIDIDVLKLQLDQIMLRGAAISGCCLPNTDFFAEIISDEVKHLLLDFEYSDFTYDEVILAMRLNSVGGMRYPSGDFMEQVNFHGNCFNGDYIAKILANYQILRNNLDRKFQNQIDGY
jgi:hypothetical protein